MGKAQDKKAKKIVLTIPVQRNINSFAFWLVLFRSVFVAPPRHRFDYGSSSLRNRAKKPSAIIRNNLCYAVLVGIFVSFPCFGKTKKGSSSTTVPQSASTKSEVVLSGQNFHISCNRSIRDLKRKKLECFGNVYIRRPSELLTSDYAELDLISEQLHAEGNVVYFTSTMVIYGAKMDYNFVTNTGVIEDGRIESDKYQLLGERIEKVGDQHFIARDGEYTTCRDCPASWKIAGHDVDLTVEGYAFLNQVYIKINDASAVYLPYAVVPVKTKRQTGLLMPKWQIISPNGFTFTQPFFWAINRSMDATISAAIYSLRGPKGEGEFRFVLSPRSHGQLNAFYLHDRSFVSPYQNRWALNYSHNLALPFGIEKKMNWVDMSDRDYIRNFGDIPGYGEVGLLSEASLSRSGRIVSAWVKANRIRNNLTNKLVGFDPNTVQVFPGVTIATTDHRFFDSFPLHWGVQANYARFWRVAPSFDPIYDPSLRPSSQFFLPGVTPLRRAQRFSLTPEIYYTARIADVLEFVPSIQYRTYYYLFDRNIVGPTARGYLISQGELATTIEHVYSDKVKHKFRPSLVYSNIPLIQENTGHPFIQQIRKAGYQFDEYDIVPVTSDTQVYFVPLGNSLTYKLGNKFILRSDQGPVKYKKIIDLTAGQSINFIEFRKPHDERRPLSRFFTLLSVDTEKVQTTGEYYYYPYVSASSYSISTRYIHDKHTYRLLNYERSVGLSYNNDQVVSHSQSVGGSFNFSINDFFSTTAGITYAFPSSLDGVESPGRVLAMNVGLSFQSPSQCYKIILTATRTIDNPTPSVNVSVPINLTGEGFMDFN